MTELGIDFFDIIDNQHNGAVKVYFVLINKKKKETLAI